LQEFHFLPTKEWVAIGAIEPQFHPLLLEKCGIGNSGTRANGRGDEDACPITD
jgi:hypothetical protein